MSTRLPNATESRKHIDQISKILTKDGSRNRTDVLIPCYGCTETIRIPLWKEDESNSTAYKTMVVDDEPGLYCSTCFSTRFTCAVCETGNKKTGYMVKYTNELNDDDSGHVFVCQDDTAFTVSKLKENPAYSGISMTEVWYPGRIWDTVRIVYKAVQN